MKKLFMIVLSLIVVFSLASCQLVVKEAPKEESTVKEEKDEDTKKDESKNVDKGSSNHSASAIPDRGVDYANEPQDLGSEGYLGDYYVSIDAAYDDYDVYGDLALTIDFTFENYSGRSTSFAEALEVYVMQDGELLGYAEVTDSYGYEEDNTLMTVYSGDTEYITASYYQYNTYDDVEVWVHERDSVNGDYLYLWFSSY